jgi:hypothetical protein
MYLARTKDAEVEKLIHQALRETMGDLESAIKLEFQDQVRDIKSRQEEIGSDQEEQRQELDKTQDDCQPSRH